MKSRHANKKHISRGHTVIHELFDWHNKTSSAQLNSRLKCINR